MTDEKKQPEKKIRIGTVAATIWGNKGEKDGEKYEFSTISLSRGYKDKEDNWQQTGSLNKSDLPKAILTLQKAYEYLCFKEGDATEAKPTTEAKPEVTEEKVA